jgi:hypothetical protein
LWRRWSAQWSPRHIRRGAGDENTAERASSETTSRERYSIARIYADGHRELALASYARLEDACCHALGMADELGKRAPAGIRGRPLNVEVQDGGTVKLSVSVVVGGLVPWACPGLFSSI